MSSQSAKPGETAGAPRCLVFILAGGAGTRLWPISVRARPKQFCRLFGGRSLLEQTVERVAGVAAPGDIFVLTTAALAETTRAALPEFPGEQVLAEPCGRNTAAAVALACGMARRIDPGAVVVCLPADHVVAPVERFRESVTAMVRVAAEFPAIATLGVVPTAPSTGYGYIEGGELLAPGRPDLEAFVVVKRFVEKPDEARARAYLAAGTFVWNAGIFAARAEVWQEAFRRVAPAWLPLIEEPERAEEIYAAVPAEPVDVAVMEKCPNLVVGRADFDWDDVGSFEAVAGHLPADAAGNVAGGAVEALDAAGNVVLVEGAARTTALVGVKDLVVVHTPTATLICPRAQAQRVRALVEKLPEALR